MQKGVDKTTLSKASVKSTFALKTSVPSFIVKLFGLKAGGKLIWRVEAEKGGNMKITVEPEN
jgi:hypothetical protein